MVGGREKIYFLREGGIWLLDRHLDLGYVLWNFTNRFFLVLKNYCLFRLKCSSSIRFIHVTAFLGEKLSDVSKNASDSMSPNCCFLMLMLYVRHGPFSVSVLLRCSGGAKGSVMLRGLPLNNLAFYTKSTFVRLWDSVCSAVAIFSATCCTTVGVGEP